MSNTPGLREQGAHDLLGCVRAPTRTMFGLAAGDVGAAATIRPAARLSTPAAAASLVVIDRFTEFGPPGRVGRGFRPIPQYVYHFSWKKHNLSSAPAPSSARPAQRSGAASRLRRTCPRPVTRVAGSRGPGGGVVQPPLARGHRGGWGSTSVGSTDRGAQAGTDGHLVMRTQPFARVKSTTDELATSSTAVQQRRRVRPPRATLRSSSSPTVTCVSQLDRRGTDPRAVAEGQR